MAHFDTMIEQKQKLRECLLNNQTVVDLLVNTGNNMAEFDHVKTGSKSPAAGLVKTHFYIPGTTTVAQNFIAMRSRVIRADSATVKETGIIIYVICNDDQIDLVQGSRADLLADEIDKILNNGRSPLFGMDDIRIATAEEVRFIEGYYGWEISFKTHEWNRKADLL